MRHAKFVGLCDANADLGKDVAKRHEVSFFRDVDSLLENVDAVSVCTPTPDHFEIVKRCLEQDIHVLVEKPFTETLEQAQALREAASKSKGIVQVGHIEKFNPAFIELRKVLDGMEVLAMNFNRLSPFQGSNVDVDVVLDLMIHDIGLVVDMFEAEPVSMDAHGFSVFTKTIDYGLAVLKYQPEKLLTLTASRVTEQKIRAISVTTRDAYIEADLLHKTIEVHRRTLGDYVNQKNTHKYRQESLIERIVVPAMEPLFLELQDFVTCVAENKTPQVTAEDGYNALRYVLMLRDKILESRRITN
jgi:virulence factor